MPSTAAAAPQNITSSSAPPLSRTQTVSSEGRGKRGYLSSNGDLNLNTSLDVDDDLLDGLGGGEEAEIDISFHLPFPSHTHPNI